jgi:hypothetical protein
VNDLAINPEKYQEYSPTFAFGFQEDFHEDFQEGFHEGLFSN